LSLDSPEKALQIFQQLREAQHIVVAIVRDNAPLSLEYNLD
jgi:general secretion pathway protein C